MSKSEKRTEPSAKPTSPATNPPCQDYSAFPSIAKPGRGLMDTRRHTRPVLEQGGSGQLAGVLGKTKTDIVVPVVCVVPVAVGRAEVVRFVVPRPPANHPPGHVWPPPLVNTMREKMDLRKPSVSAWLAWPIQLCTEGLKSSQSNRPLRYASANPLNL